MVELLRVGLTFCCEGEFQVQLAMRRAFQSKKTVEHIKPAKSEYDQHYAEPGFAVIHPENAGQAPPRPEEKLLVKTKTSPARISSYNSDQDPQTHHTRQ